MQSASISKPSASTGNSQSSQFAAVVANPNLSSQKRKDRGANISSLVAEDDSSSEPEIPPVENSPAGRVRFGTTALFILLLNFYIYV